MLYNQILENDWLGEKPRKLLIKRVKILHIKKKSNNILKLIVLFYSWKTYKLILGMTMFQYSYSTNSILLVLIKLLLPITLKKHVPS